MSGFGNAFLRPKCVYVKVLYHKSRWYGEQIVFFAEPGGTELTDVRMLLMEHPHCNAKPQIDRLRDFACVVL